jgi:hypothetical protein
LLNPAHRPQSEPVSADHKHRRTVQNFFTISPERVMTRSLPRIHPDNAQFLNGSAWFPSVTGWDSLGGVFNPAPKIG